MKICIDLDNVIAKFKQNKQTYKDVKPIPGAIQKIQKLKQNGHYIIIQTARHMKTCQSNQGLIVKKIGKITLDWLEKYKIPYDEIYFGKPHADIYIDDNAYRFKNWKNIKDDGSNLPKSNEKTQNVTKKF